MPRHALRSALKSKSQFSFVGCFSWKCQDSGQSCTGLFVAARFPQNVQCFRETLWTRWRQGSFRCGQETFRFILLFPSFYISAHLPHFACTQICIWPNYFPTTGKVFVFFMVHAPSHYIDVAMTAVSVASGVSVSTMHQQQNKLWDMRADVAHQKQYGLWWILCQISLGSIIRWRKCDK